MSERSNIYAKLRVANRLFSSLFHVNNNPNYAGIDIWTDYYDEKLQISNPELYKYLETRRFTKKAGREYMRLCLVCSLTSTFSLSATTTGDGTNAPGLFLMELSHLQREKIPD